MKIKIKTSYRCLLAFLILFMGLAFFSTNYFVPEPDPRPSAENFTGRNADDIARNHPDVTFWVTTDKPRYFIGDEIKISLHFENRNPGNNLIIDNRTYDRSGRFHENEYIVDGPDGGWCDPLRRMDYFTWGGGLGSGDEPLTTAQREYPLNDYIRFDKPGTYYVYCTSRLIRLSTEVKMTSAPIQILISDPRILATFRKTQWYSFLACLPMGRIREHALGKLRCLANHGATDAFSHRFASNALAATMGTFGSRDSEYAREAMISGLRNPGIEINQGYLVSLIGISMPESTFSSLETASRAGIKEQVEAAFKKYHQEVTSYKREYLDLLYQGIDRRTGKNLAHACALLLDDKLGNDLSYMKAVEKAVDEDKHDLPGQRPEDVKVRKLMAKAFHHFDCDQKDYLLRYSWNDICCEEFNPVLEDIIQDCQKRIGADADSLGVRDAQALLELAQMRLLQLQEKGIHQGSER